MTSSDEVRVTRRFDAPREVVFRAWVEPEQVAMWWSPHEFEVPRPTVEIDPRAGGRIHFSMRGRGDGTDYPVRFEIVELREPELLVLSSEAMPEVGLAFPTVTRVVFEVEDGGTRVTITQGPHTGELLPLAQAGWEGSLDKLESLLAA
jgi:uncharacterized protein YndB with AHSA1/START domain